MTENTVKHIDETSPLYGKVHEGDVLISINGQKIADVLDYKFFSYDRKLDLVFSSGEYHVEKPEGLDLGIDFESYLMDAPRSCANNCIFCFIDQLPKGMRKTMYFKDDDARLSFLLGNYITLTNLSDREIQRIVDLKISPVNVSVHATNPELRVKMLRNRFAGNLMERMKKMAQGGIEMNCQVVCCPGVNDDAELLRTMRELAELYPQVNSVSIVPVGLTKFRDGLYPLVPFTKEHAIETLDMVEAFADECLKKYGSRIFFCGDEFYLLSDRDVPEDEYYENYTQLENGVGMMRLLETEFNSALSLGCDEKDPPAFSIACGTSVKRLFEKLVFTANSKYDKIKGNVYAIENDFFGHRINVTGLITGQDLISQLKGKDLGEVLLISQNCIRREERDFLDDITIAQAEEALGVKIVTVEQDGFALFDAMCGIYNTEIKVKYGEEYLDE